MSRWIKVGELKSAQQQRNFLAATTAIFFLASAILCGVADSQAKELARREKAYDQQADDNKAMTMELVITKDALAQERRDLKAVTRAFRYCDQHSTPRPRP